MANTEDKRIPFESTMKDIKDAIGNVARAIEQGGGSGGHTIQNSAGTDLPQEDKLQFVDAHLSDDSTNGRTVVENIKELTLAELEQETERGMYLATDEESVPIGEIGEDYVEVVADGEKTLVTLLGELYTKTDFSKIRDNSFITINISGRRFIYLADDLDIPRNSATFTWTDVYSHTALISVGLEVSANPIAEQVYNGTYSDVSNTKYANGTKITLHYGTSSGIVELNTEISYSTAERKIGKWIDGSDLYEKTINCGALPNATSKTFTHGIANISKIVDIKGYATDGTWSLPLPFAGDSTSAISVYANASQIRFVSGADRTSYTTYVTLRYTKV